MGGTDMMQIILDLAKEDSEEGRSMAAAVDEGQSLRDLVASWAQHNGCIVLLDVHQKTQGGNFWWTEQQAHEQLATMVAAMVGSVRAPGACVLQLVIELSHTALKQALQPRCDSVQGSSITYEQRAAALQADKSWQLYQQAKQLIPMLQTRLPNNVKLGVSFCAAGQEFDFSLRQTFSEAASIARNSGWDPTSMRKVVVARDSDLIVTGWDAGLDTYGTSVGLSPESIASPRTTVVELAPAWKALAVQNSFHAITVLAARTTDLMDRAHQPNRSHKRLKVTRRAVSGINTRDLLAAVVQANPTTPALAAAAVGLEPGTVQHSAFLATMLYACYCPDITTDAQGLYTATWRRDLTEECRHTFAASIYTMLPLQGMQVLMACSSAQLQAMATGQGSIDLAAGSQYYGVNRSSSSGSGAVSSELLLSSTGSALVTSYTQTTSSDPLKLLSLIMAELAAAAQEPMPLALMLRSCTSQYDDLTDQATCSRFFKETSGMNNTTVNRALQEDGRQQLRFVAVQFQDSCLGTGKSAPKQLHYVCPSNMSESSCLAWVAAQQQQIQERHLQEFGMQAQSCRQLIPVVQQDSPDIMPKGCCSISALIRRYSQAESVLYLGFREGADSSSGSKSSAKCWPWDRTVDASQVLVPADTPHGRLISPLVAFKARVPKVCKNSQGRVWIQFSEHACVAVSYDIALFAVERLGKVADSSIIPELNSLRAECAKAAHELFTLRKALNRARGPAKRQWQERVDAASTAAAAAKEAVADKEMQLVDLAKGLVDE